MDYSEIHMGTRVTITCYVSDKSRADIAIRAAFDRFADIDSKMSDYRVDSELNRFCANAGFGSQKISRDLASVLDASQRLAELTNGAFDVTCRPLIKLWRASRQSGKLPDPFELSSALKLSGWRGLSVDLDHQTAILDQPGMQIDLGGIAKGYACDEALRTLKSHGVPMAMVVAGGDIALGDAPPNKEGWVIRSKALGKTSFVLENCGVSTSGDSEQFIIIDNKRYSHIIDPRTGMGLTHRMEVTVIANNCITSDSLATAFCVMGPQGINMLTEHYNFKAYFYRHHEDIIV
jgi:thiamine biosynthesis lipoprotein